jgi:hypothetical protein
MFLILSEIANLVLISKEFFLKVKHQNVGNNFLHLKVRPVGLVPKNIGDFIGQNFEKNVIVV